MLPSELCLSADLFLPSISSKLDLEFVCIDDRFAACVVFLSASSPSCDPS